MNQIDSHLALAKKQRALKQYNDLTIALLQLSLE